MRAGNRSGIACDWWENAERDFDLARELSLTALRLSVDWARVEPGIGRFDDAALARYREMVVALRERGIEPMVTLHHFDHPVWFEDLGGFAHPDSVALFLRFARRAVEALGDVCSEWVTFNEPNVYATAGYVLGDFPPGRRGDTLGRDARAGQHGARARRAYRLIHERVPGAFVSWVQHCSPSCRTGPPTPGDRWTARLSDRMFNAPFLELARDGRTSGPPGLRIEVPEMREHATSSGSTSTGAGAPGSRCASGVRRSTRSRLRPPTRGAATPARRRSSASPGRRASRRSWSGSRISASPSW